MSGFFRSLHRSAIGIGAVTLLAASQSQAAIDLSPAPPTLVGSDYVYDYSAVLTGNNNHVKTNDYFVIFDFGSSTGFVTPSGWTASLSSAPVTGAGGLIDDSSVDNLIWTYTGVTTLNGTVGGLPLGTFQAKSAYDARPLPADFISRYSVNAGTHNGAEPLNEWVYVPVPEPMSVGIIGIGALGFLARRRTR